MLGLSETRCFTDEAEVLLAKVQREVDDSAEARAAHAEAHVEAGRNVYLCNM